VKSVKHTGFVSFGHSLKLFVVGAICARLSKRTFIFGKNYDGVFKFAVCVRESLTAELFVPRFPVT